MACSDISEDTFNSFSADFFSALKNIPTLHVKENKTLRIWPTTFPVTWPEVSEGNLLKLGALRPYKYLLHYRNSEWSRCTVTGPDVCLLFDRRMNGTLGIRHLKNINTDKKKISHVNKHSTIFLSSELTITMVAAVSVKSTAKQNIK